MTVYWSYMWISAEGCVRSREGGCMNGPRIESYEFGRMAIDGKAYTKDLILLPDRILDGWWRQEGTYFTRPTWKWSSRLSWIS